MFQFSYSRYDLWLPLSIKFSFNTDGTQSASSISNALTILEKGVKAGKEFIGTDDPLQAAVTVLGKNAVGSFLSKLATCQCAGLIGFIVNTLAPEVSIEYDIKNHRHNIL